MDSKIEHDGIRLRNYRVMKNITLTKAATLCGVSKSELSKLESGARPIRPDHVIKLAGVYGITPLALLTPESKLRAFVERAADVQTATPSDIPLFDGKSLSLQKELARASGKVPCPMQLADVSGAYAISISDMANAPALLPGIILYVHPRRPVVINDLVVNRISWSPLVFYLRQSDDGDLYGLTLSKKRVDLQVDDIERLHKVAGIWMISTNGG